MDQEKIGRFIAECRKKMNMTQQEVADKLGISQSYISRIEKKVINNLKKDFTA